MELILVAGVAASSELEIAKARLAVTPVFWSWYFDYGLAPDVPFRTIGEVSIPEERNTTPCKPCRTTEATNPISSSKTLLFSARDLTLFSVATHRLTERLAPLPPL